MYKNDVATKALFTIIIETGLVFIKETLVVPLDVNTPLLPHTHTDTQNNNNKSKNKKK